jgi:hypothetical protein
LQHSDVILQIQARWIISARLKHTKIPDVSILNLDGIPNPPSSQLTYFDFDVDIDGFNFGTDYIQEWAEIAEANRFNSFDNIEDTPPIF